MVKNITRFLLVLKKTDITLTLYQCVTHASPYCCWGNRQVLFLGLLSTVENLYDSNTGDVCNIVITDKYLKLTLQLWTPELSQIKKNENSFTAKQQTRLCATK